MSDAAGRMRMAADDLSDARTSLRQGDLDVDGYVPEGAPDPEKIIKKIDGQIVELQSALRELAANVDVMEEVDERD